MKKYGIVALVFSFLDKKRFVLGLILSLASAGLGLFVPQAIGNLLDSQFLVQLLKSPIQLIVLVAFLIATYCLQAVAGYLIGQSGSAAVEKLQGYLHDSLLSASVQSIEDYSAGDLASRLTSDVSVVLTTVAGLFPKLLLNSVIVIGSVYFLFQISVPLTMSSLFLLPLLALVFIPINQRLEAHYGAYQGKMGEVSGRISHRLTTIRLIKAFQGEKDEQASMTAALSSLQTSFRRIIGWTVFQSSLVNSVMMLFILFQLLVAGQAVANGQMTMATLTTFVLYMMQLIGPVADLSETLAEWTEFTSVRARLTDILCLDREGVGTEKVSLTATEIVFNAVSFAYGEENVLENLSFSIPSGSHVAIVGPSGAGKSTVFSLLMKYYTDYRGDIRVGGHSLSSLSSGQVRQLMSYIPQDNTLFHGTLRDNLLYGKNSHVTEERLRFILDELGLSQLLAELEDGLDTVILENGSGLSEGQKQRFSIARALLLEHSIYLMDEVTASLDSVTEQEVSQAIDRLTAGKTRLTIAHRLHTVREADLILVFDKRGQLVDCGNHQQLSKQNALYQDFLRTLPRAS